MTKQEKLIQACEDHIYFRRKINEQIYPCMIIQDLIDVLKSGEQNKAETLDLIKEGECHVKRYKDYLPYHKVDRLILMLIKEIKNGTD